MLHFSYVVMTALRFAGVLVVFAGVALSGGYFIRGNARSTDGCVPRSAWLGAGPMTGICIVGVGAGLLTGAFLISLFMPNGS
jgi:hypothetical protein